MLQEQSSGPRTSARDYGGEENLQFCFRSVYCGKTFELAEQSRLRASVLALRADSMGGRIVSDRSIGVASMDTSAGPWTERYHSSCRPALFTKPNQKDVIALSPIGDCNWVGTKQARWPPKRHENTIVSRKPAILGDQGALLDAGREWIETSVGIE